MNIIKNFKRNGLKALKFPALAMALVVGVTSCKDNDDNFTPIDSTAVAVFNAATETEDVNFFLNDEKINKELLGLGSHVSYHETLAGKYKAEFKTESGESVLEDSIKFDTKKAYSLFLVNEGEAVDVVKIDDETSTPKEGKAHIRFVHVSSDAGKLNFSIANTDEDAETTYLFEDRDFKTATSFKEIEAGKQTFNVVEPLDGETVFALSDVSIEAGGIYTIWVKGLKNSDIDDQQIEALIYKNN